MITFSVLRLDYVNNFDAKIKVNIPASFLYIIVDNITNARNASILFEGIGPTIGVKFSLN